MVIFTDKEKQWIKREKFNWKIKDGCPADIEKSINTKLNFLYGKETMKHDETV